MNRVGSTIYGLLRRFNWQLNGKVCISWLGNNANVTVIRPFSYNSSGNRIVFLNRPHTAPLLTMKLRSFYSVLAVGVLALLLVGAGGFFWLRSNSPLALLDGAAQNPAAAIFVPKQAPAMVSLLVNPDRLEGFVQLVAPPSERKSSREALNQLKQGLLGNTGLDYKRDVQPWLGDEITLAVTSPDVDRNGQNGEQPGYLLALTTKNPQRSREFLDLFWQRQTVAGSPDLVFEQYKGVQLISRNQPSTTFSQQANKRGFYKRDQSTSVKAANSLASAIIGDRFVLFASNAKVLRDAINNVQAPDLSLSEDRSYQLALESITQPKIGVSFVNIPALAAWLGDHSVLEDLEVYKTLAVALSLNQKGLLAETAILASADASVSSTMPTQAQPVEALQYIPAGTVLAAAGTHLDQLWQQFSTGLGKDQILSPLVNQPLKELETRWSIQLPQDIFSWVQGEYALGMLPRAQGNPDWIFVAEKSADTAEASIEHLDQLAKQRGLSIGSLSLRNQPISAWTQLTTVPSENQAPGVVRLEAQVSGVHAAVGKYEIFTSTVEAMDQALKAPGSSLVKSANFQNSLSALPPPNNGYLYLDWSSSQTLLEHQLPILRVVELFGKPLLSQLSSLTLSSYGSEKGVQRSKIFFQFGIDSKS